MVPTLTLHRYLFHTNGGDTPHFRYDSRGVRLSCYSALRTGRDHSPLFKYGTGGSPFLIYREGFSSALYVCGNGTMLRRLPSNLLQFS